MILVLACTKKAPVALAPTVPTVVVAVEDVDAGGVLTAQQVRLAEALAWGPGVFTDVAEVVGRVAIEPLISGEAVRQARLADPEQPPGKVAMRLAGTPVGPLASGDFVDLLRLGAEVDTVAAGVRVLSVHQDGLTVAVDEDFDTEGPWSWTMRSPLDITGFGEHGPTVVLDTPPGADAWVATRELRAGVPITEADLVRVDLPASLSAALDVEVQLPVLTSTPILPGEVLTSARIVDDPASRPAPFLPREMRGLTIEHDLGPPLIPGTYLDVVVSSAERSTVLLQAAFVLATHSTATTLLLTRSQAESLAQAAHDPDRRVSIAVRNDRDVRQGDLEDYVPEMP